MHIVTFRYLGLKLLCLSPVLHTHVATGCQPPSVSLSQHNTLHNSCRVSFTIFRLYSLSSLGGSSTRSNLDCFVRHLHTACINQSCSPRLSEPSLPSSDLALGPHICGSCSIQNMGAEIRHDYFMQLYF